MCLKTGGRHVRNSDKFGFRTLTVIHICTCMDPKIHFSMKRLAIMNFALFIFANTNLYFCCFDVQQNKLTNIVSQILGRSGNLKFRLLKTKLNDPIKTF